MNDQLFPVRLTRRDLLQAAGAGAAALSAGVGYTPDQIAATAHGLYWSKEGPKPENEFLYFTENAGPGGLGARVYKTDMKGKILYQVGNVAAESSTAQKFRFTNPTDVA